MASRLELDIAVELGKAMRRLGGNPDLVVHPSLRGDRLYDSFQKLGAKSDLLGIVGSYGETQPDEWVLEQLRRWNAGGP